MRFPNFSDLDAEQVRIYGRAPTEGAVLIVGPPGTGKTIMAFHRAQKLAALGQSPKVIMFNKVLRKYTESRDGIAPEVPVMTMHKWVSDWWRKARLGSPPKDANDSWSYDWMKILEIVTGLNGGDGKLKALNWGHLIIDEGQDFPEAMYYALGNIIHHMAKFDIKARLTVFADDNQRLEINKNSTVENIEKFLRLKGKEDRVFYLRKNYRNTKEVARFAQYFQVGRSSGAAKLPSVTGDKPAIGMFNDEREVFEFIARKIRISPGKQVGVIVHGSIKDVKSTYNKLASRCGDPIRVQRYYSSKNEKLDETLEFGGGNVVTVVNERSAKGLEFDIVFYVGLQKVNFDNSGALNERMVSYVISSRAREELLVLFSGIQPGERCPDGLRMMPRYDLGLSRFDGFGDLSGHLPGILRSIEWREPEPDAPFWQDAAQ
jgi:DNA helicase IV